ncbi:rifin [Plasmodium reichenowi]|uniref:Rifin n=1 Tax=Plasmodium reichenowi TaxID=5854 RepID=A0A060RR04_PLARE|nr:rifin [Plasmodium reichenowi]
MNVHYINILLFALALNILVHNKNKPQTTSPHTRTTRLLCECELYAPANYDNDPQMKEVMQQFEDRTTQRFHEYDDRMVEKRKRCKDKCDKEIQKIILKDKLEKELMDKFATLDTNIQNDAIPTCICEKSLADKVEKGCLRCAQNLGGIVVPSSGVIGEIGAFAVYAWKNAAIEAATKYALAQGAAQGLAEGNSYAMNMVITFLKRWGVDEFCPEIFNPFVATNRYTELANIGNAIIKRHVEMCADTIGNDGAMCKAFGLRLGTHSTSLNIPPHPTKFFVGEKIKGLAAKADQAAKALAETTSKDVAAVIKAEKTGVINSIYISNQTAISASIIAIVVIVVIMVIIYLILLHRRKKKMKKKLHYIKLIDE